MKVPGMYVVIRGDYTELKKDFAAVRGEAKAAGTDISNALGNALVPSQVQNGINSLYQNLTKASRAASISRESFEGLGVTLDAKLRRNLNMTEREWTQLQQRMLQTQAQNAAEKALNSVARAANLSAREIAMLKLKVGDTDGAMRDFGRIAQGRFAALRSSVTSLQSAIATLGLGLLAKDIFDTGAEVMQLNRAFQAITGSAAGAQAEFAFLRRLADDLGMNFYDIAGGFKEISAAARGTAMEGEPVRAVFTSIVEAGGALGMSAEQVKGSLYAVGQMISKGKVSAEELRRQLGDRLPGAFQIAARAMNVSTAELDKMLQTGELFTDDFLPRFAAEIHRMYSEPAKAASRDAARALDKFRESWMDIKVEMANSGFLDDATAALRDMADTLKDPTVREAMKELAGSLGSIIKAMGTATQYAGLRSIGGTYAEGMGLVKQGLLDKASFDRAGFLERQQMVDRLKSGGDGAGTTNWRGRGDDRPKPAAAIAMSAADTSSAVRAAEAAAADFLKETNAAKMEKIVKAADDAVAKLKQARATDAANAAQYDAQISAVEAERARKIAELGNKQDSAAQKATTAFKKLNDEMARLTMNPDEYARHQLANEISEYEKALGKANPQLAQFIALKERELKYKSLSRLEPYQVTQLEALNRGDSFYGRAEAEKRATEMLKQRQQENLQLQTEFAEKHRQIVLGETDFKLEQIEAQAEAYRRAGADSVAVEQWAKEQRIQVARDWQSGAIRAFRSYYDEAMDSAAGVERVIKGTFKSMEDAIVQFAMTGKFSFADMTNSIIADMVRMTVQRGITGPLAGAAGSWLAGSLGGGAGPFSLLASFFHGGGMIGRDAPSFMRPVDPAVFAGAPRHHTGLLPDEFPAILQKGETVIPKGGFNMAPLNMGGGVTVNIYNNSGTVQARAQQRQNANGGLDLDVIIEEIDRHIATGIENGTNRTGAVLERVYGQNRAGSLY